MQGGFWGELCGVVDTATCDDAAPEVVTFLVEMWERLADSLTCVEAHPDV